MSRVGKAPIPIPEGVSIDKNGNVIKANGPKGELTITVHPEMNVEIDNNVISVTRPTDNKMHRSLHGLSRTLVSNIVEGVSKGFEKRLEIVGVGYRAEMKGKKLLLSLGYSHQILFVPSEAIDISLEGYNIIIIKGINKELVGQTAAKNQIFSPT